MGLTFEWDPNKERLNQKKHHVSFEEATTAFNDPFSSVFFDPDHSELEERYILLGTSTLRTLLVISFTDRENRVRIISARKATSKERYSYEEKNKR